MASLNKVLLIATLGKDPEIRYTTSGTAVAGFSAATNERFKNKAGEWEERTEWHNIVLWGRLAEIAGEHLSKGKCVYIEGRLQTGKWQDRDGKDRSTTEIVGEKLQSDRRHGAFQRRHHYHPAHQGGRRADGHQAAGSHHHR